jgi:plasmid maintenance system antidote protein VapI
MEALFWINLQAEYDLEMAMRESYKAIFKEVKPFEDAA